jgi:DNA-binding transcriptional regulator YiaG
MSIAIEQLMQDAKRSRSLPAPPVRRYLREQVGLSQEAVAEALGIGRTAVTRWETGSREPRGAVRLEYVELLERMAREVNGG